MASFKVQDATGTGTAANSLTAVWGSNTTAGNLIVVLVGTTSTTTNSVTSITDSQSNQYTQIATNETSGSLGDVEIWYAKNILGGATPTITINLGGVLTSAAIAREYYGLDTVNPLNVSNGSATGSSTSPTSNTIKTTQAPQMLVGYMGQVGVTGAISLGTGYSNLNTKSNGNEVAIEDQYVTATGSQSSSFSLTLSLQWECGIVAFDEAPHGTTTSTSSTSSTSSSTSSTSSSTSSTSTSFSSTSVSTSSTSTSTSTSITTISTSSTSSSTSSTSTSSTSSSTSISSTSSSISSTSVSSTSRSTTSGSTSISSTSSSFSSTSSSISSTSASTSSTSVSSTSSSSSTSSTTLPPPNIDYSYEDRAAVAKVDQFIQTGTWIAPVGVTSVLVHCWGAGGAGGGSDTGGVIAGGGGGGGGAYANKTITVTPGTSYTVTVGVGGAGAIATSGTNGTDSWFSTSGTVIAKAGLGGAFISGGGGAGGAGGAAGSSIGDVAHSGGSGAAAPGSNGGGGGGSAGDLTDGSAASTSTGGGAGSGLVVNGAFGATGPGLAADGKGGRTPGSGGSGGQGSAPSHAGGAGSNGFVLISYTTTAIPTNATDLANRMTSKNYADVAVDDGGYFIQTGSENVIANFQKWWTNNTDNITITWTGRTTISPAKSPVLLQIYNVNSAAWETIDTETLKPVDTDFTMQATVSTNPSNYYGTNNQITARVYQLVY